MDTSAYSSDSPSAIGPFDQWASIFSLEYLDDCGETVMVDRASRLLEEKNDQSSRQCDNATCAGYMTFQTPSDMWLRGVNMALAFKVPPRQNGDSSRRH